METSIQKPWRRSKPEIKRWKPSFLQVTKIDKEIGMWNQSSCIRILSLKGTHLNRNNLLRKTEVWLADHQFELYLYIYIYTSIYVYLILLIKNKTFLISKLYTFVSLIKNS